MSEILLNAEEKMMGIIDNLESNLRQIRTRSNICPLARPVRI